MTRREWESEVRIALYKRHESLIDVAKAINYSTSHVRKVACGCSESIRVENAISAYLGIGFIDRE